MRVGRAIKAAALTLGGVAAAIVVAAMLVPSFWLWLKLLPGAIDQWASNLVGGSGERRYLIAKIASEKKEHVIRVRFFCRKEVRVSPRGHRTHRMYLANPTVVVSKISGRILIASLPDQVCRGIGTLSKETPFLFYIDNAEKPTSVLKFVARHLSKIENIGLPKLISMDIRDSISNGVVSGNATSAYAAERKIYKFSRLDRNPTYLAAYIFEVLPNETWSLELRGIISSNLQKNEIINIGKYIENIKIKNIEMNKKIIETFYLWDNSISNEQILMYRLRIRPAHFQSSNVNLLENEKDVIRYQLVSGQPPNIVRFRGAMIQLEGAGNVSVSDWHYSKQLNVVFRIWRHWHFQYGLYK